MQSKFNNQFKSILFMKQNSILRKSAKAALSGHWASAVLFVLVFGALYLLVQLPNYVGQGFLDNSPLISFVLSLLCLVLIFLFLPASWSFEVAFLSQLREKDSFSLRSLFCGYSDFGRVFSTCFGIDIYTTCWGLLLLVPGIIKAYSYAMTPYILLDDKDIHGEDAIDKSMKMMDGHKWQLFKLDLLFGLLFLLGIFTVGIAWLWIFPWWYSSRAAFYEELRLENEAHLVVAEEEMK